MAGAGAVEMELAKEVTSYGEKCEGMFDKQSYGRPKSYRVCKTRLFLRLDDRSYWLMA